MNRLTPVVVSAVLASLGTTVPVQAARIQVDDQTTLNVGALVQTWGVMTADSAPDGGPGGDFYLRRARLIVSGQYKDGLSFFVETDQPNLGKNGDFSSSFYVQDAFMSLKFNANFTVDAGLLLLPFTHHSLQGATSLNTLDYHSALVRYPAGSALVWRDVGVQARAQLLDGKVLLRGGLFNGVEGDPTATDANGEGLAPLNPSDLPRATAHARVCLLGTEPDFFYKGIYFTTQPVVSLGIGVDYQADAVRAATGPADALSLGADVFADVPVRSGQELVAQAGAYYYDHGAVATSGFGGFAELGYRVGKLEPLLSVDYFQATEGGSDLLGLHAGLNYWIREHNASVKGDMGIVRQGELATVDPALTGTVQAQLYF